MITDGNLSCCLPASPPNRDQKETGGVYKEGKSAQDQGTSFPFQQPMLICFVNLLLNHMKQKQERLHLQI